MGNKILTLKYKFSRTPNNGLSMPNVSVLQRQGDLLRISMRGESSVAYVSPKWDITINKSVTDGKVNNTSVILTSPYDHGISAEVPPLPSNFYPVQLLKKSNGQYFLDLDSTPQVGGLWYGFNQAKFDKEGHPSYFEKGMFPGYSVQTHYYDWQQLDGYWFPRRIETKFYTYWVHLIADTKYVLVSSALTKGKLNVINDLSDLQTVDDLRATPKRDEFTFKKGTMAQFWKQANSRVYGTLLPPNPPEPILERINTSVPFVIEMRILMPLFLFILVPAALIFLGIRYLLKVRNQKGTGT